MADASSSRLTSHFKRSTPAFSNAQAAGEDGKIVWGEDLKKSK